MDPDRSSAPQLVKPPQQDRSRRTLNRIVKAALDLIEERGVDGASVQDIARRARASVGSFYARFDGKEDLLRYLEVQLWSDVDTTWRKALEARDWNTLSFEDLVATLVRVLVEVHRAGARQRRLLEARRGPEASSDAARKFDEMLSRDIRHLLLGHADRIDRPDPARAIDLCIGIVVGTLRMRDAGHLSLQSLSAYDDDDWAQALTRVCLAYLAGSTEVGEGRGKMDFFEIWA